MTDAQISNVEMTSSVVAPLPMIIWDYHWRHRFWVRYISWRHHTYTYNSRMDDRQIFVKFGTDIVSFVLILNSIHFILYLTTPTSRMSAV
jgi:hypothetical protein